MTDNGARPDETFTSPLKAIREFCFDCSGGDVVERKNCASPKCPLYAFRFGKNPYHTRVITEEQKEKYRESLNALRKNKCTTVSEEQNDTLQG